MRKIVGLVAVCAAAPLGAQPSGPEVLARVRETYAKLTAIHLVADRDEVRAVRGRSFSGSVECEIADASGGRYFVRMKTQQDAIAVSDGENIWKAMPALKKWCKIAAASISDDDDDQPPAADFEGLDLHTNMQKILLSHFAALAKAAEDPVIVKEEDYKIGHEKVRCYRMRMHAGHTQFELLVDKSRFVVLEEKQKGAMGEATIKVKQLELNDQVSGDLFRFTPERNWHETEMLILPGEGQISMVGVKAANFTLKSLAGEQVALANLRDKVVVLDFWATWCPPCRAELPHIEKMRHEFGDAVAFYGVNDEEDGTVKSFQKQHKYELPVLMDRTRVVHRLYGVHAIPTLLVVDRGGVIRQAFTGQRSEDTLRKAIQSVVESK